MFVESFKKPVGHIHIRECKGEVLHRPWGIGPDDTFGYLDFSNAEIVREHQVHNLIVNQASAFMAMRMAPGNLGTAGISHLAMGSGVGTGTPTTPQGEDPTYVKLRQEVARKAITSWTYLDANSAPVGSPPTGVGALGLSTQFGVNEANFSLVEMGLFGGSNASATDGGFMYNYKTFSAWNKTAQMQNVLVVTWNLTF